MVMFEQTTTQSWTGPISSGEERFFPDIKERETIPYNLQKTERILRYLSGSDRRRTDTEVNTPPMLVGPGWLPQDDHDNPRAIAPG